jgi:hypothetical protein
MTNVAVWYVSKTDEVWGVGDARVRSRHAQLTDQAAKILPLTLRLLNPADAGPGWKEGTQATIGFAYAGNTMSALLTHAALSVFLAHIGGNGASLPPMRKVSDLCAHVSQRYVKDIGVAAARPAAEYVIYGRCPASGEFAAFHVQAGRDGGMRIETEVEMSEIEPALNWVLGKIGGDLAKKMKGIEQQRRRNPLLMSYFQETFALEFALEKARDRRRSTGRIPRDEAFAVAYGFAAAIERIHNALPIPAANRLTSRLRGAMKDQYGLRPLGYEVQTAVHLMRRGFDVELVDLVGIGNFDFLAVRDGVSVEVECKTTSPDTGRKIHRAEVHRLADLILPVTKRLVESEGLHVIRVVIPDRLEPSDESLRQTASLVSCVLSSATASNAAGRAE